MYRGEELLVLDCCRLVVLTQKREAILELLHTGHSGIAKTVGLLSCMSWRCRCGRCVDVLGLLRVFV